MKPTGPARSGQPNDRLREIRERCLKVNGDPRRENIVIASEAKQSSSATTFAQASGLLRRLRSSQ
jgi:hypothetical protein